MCDDVIGQVEAMDAFVVGTSAFFCEKYYFEFQEKLKNLANTCRRLIYLYCTKCSAKNRFVLGYRRKIF
jgi:hypothetical protein